MEEEAKQEPNLIQYPAVRVEVEEALKLIFDSQNPLDNPSIDLTSYINDKFPDEDSLKNSDNVLKDIDDEILALDEEIKEHVREQALAQDQIKSHLGNLNSEVANLVDRIKVIQEKAQVSEMLVKAICSDIRSLDYAKKNIIFTITSLKKLIMLINGIEQLREFCINKKYKEAANLIEATDDLFLAFEEYKNISHIAALKEEKDNLSKNLRIQIMQEFRLNNYDDGLPPSLEEGAYVIDALGPQAINEVKEWFSEFILQPYQKVFNVGEEAGAFENSERRFGWLKNTLREFKVKYESSFPQHWVMPIHISLEFCKITRNHLEELLSKAYRIVDVSILIKILKKTQDLEEDLYKKFTYEQANKVGYDIDNYQVTHSEVGTIIDVGSAQEIEKKYKAAQKKEQEIKTAQEKSIVFKERTINYSVPKFKGLISSVFEPYLAYYAESEEKKLRESVDKMIAPDKIEEGEYPTLCSSMLLFGNIKTSLKRCLSFSTSRALFDLHNTFKKIFKYYCQSIRSTIPQIPTNPNEKLKLTEKDEEQIVYIINSCQYCLETMKGLQSILEEKIDEEFKETVNLYVAEDYFNDLINEAINLFMLNIETKMDTHFSTMLKTNWGTFEKVGDTSSYVKGLGEAFLSSSRKIQPILHETFYMSIINRIANELKTHYLNHLYECKKINEFSAQQLLLDVTDLKSKLLSLLKIGTKKQKDEILQLQKDSFINFVNKEMHKIESRLKILGYPLENIGDAYTSLINDKSKEDFHKLLLLKGVKKTDLNNYQFN